MNTRLAKSKSRRSSRRPLPRFNPASLLLPYQSHWVVDDARIKLWLASRQIGKSFAAACELVRDCHLNSPTTWLVLSAGERQAIEFLDKVRMWAAEFARWRKQQSPFEDLDEPSCHRHEIRLAGGSRVIALPANPDTVRGYSANVLLDEFAFYEDSAAIWRAILPTISNPLRGPLKLRILSTANGKANSFYKLWTAGSTAWARHRTTVHDAVAAGLNMDIQGLRQDINDPDDWAQEYECEFLDTSTVLLPYQLIDSCEHPDARETSSWAQPDPSDPPPEDLYLGVDIGRKRDLTVIWGLEEVGDVLWTRLVRVMEQAPFRDQFELLKHLCGKAARVCIDATGVGSMLAEELGHEFGKCIEPCQFTASFNQELYPPLRRKFEERAIRIPATLAIREDLHSLRRAVSESGRVLYRAPHTDDGHCDRATALALAVRAAATVVRRDRFWIPPGPLADLLARRFDQYSAL